MSHVYMELVRSWTMNTQKHWLFDRVDSCSLSIPTRVNPSPPHRREAGKAPEKLAIRAIAGGEQYFWSKDPDEKEIILNRVRGHKSRGINNYDFRRYHRIICFDESIRQQLEAMRANEMASMPDKVMSKIHRLPGCEEFYWRWTWDVEKLLQYGGKIKVAIKQFLAPEFGWVQPMSGITLGKWRTLQFVIPFELAMAVKQNKSLAEADRRGCKVNMVEELYRKTTLVSISGPRGQLEETRKVIFGDF